MKIIAAAFVALLFAPLEAKLGEEKKFDDALDKFKGASYTVHHNQGERKLSKKSKSSTYSKTTYSKNSKKGSKSSTYSQNSNKGSTYNTYNTYGSKKGSG